MREKNDTRNHAVALAILLTTMVAGTTEAQTSLPFIDTLGASDAAVDDKQKLSLYEIAIPFYTDDHPYGYALNELSIDFDAGGTGANDISYVSIQRHNESGGPLATAITHIPGANVPAYSGYFGRGATGQSPAVAGVNVYRPRSGSFSGAARSEIYLDANTRYWIRIAASGSGSTATVAQTLDANPTWPWETGDITLRGQGSTGSWSVNQGTRTLKFKAMARLLTKRTVTIEDAEATDESDGTLSFRVTLDQASDVHVQVPWYTSNETATAGEDYTEEHGLMIFEPAWANDGNAETELTISIPITDDTTAEPSETFNMHLGRDEQYRQGVVGAQLTNNRGVGTIVNNDATALTASFTGMPETHDGSSNFSFDVEFSEEVGISYVTMRDTAFTVENGDVKGARRTNGQHDEWRITIKPDATHDVTVTLPETTSCTAAAAVCTRGDNARPLTNRTTATVRGPDVEPVLPVAGGLTATLSDVPEEHETGRSPSRSRSTRTWRRATHASETTSSR